jgi:hypothetical protein
VLVIRQSDQVRFFGHFGVLSVCQAVYNPRFQIYCWCDFASTAEAVSDGTSFRCPFKVRLRTGFTRMCPTVPGLSFVTSDELARSMLSEMDLHCFRLRYTIPAGEGNLMSMIVTGSDDRFQHFSAQQPPKAPTNTFLSDLRSLGSSSRTSPYGRASAREPVSGSGRGGRGRGGRGGHRGGHPVVELAAAVPGDPGPDLLGIVGADAAIVDVDGIDEGGEDILEDLPLEDIAEVVENIVDVDLGTDVADLPSDSSQPNVVIVPDPPLPPPAPEEPAAEVLVVGSGAASASAATSANAWDEIEGPSPSGDFCYKGRRIGKLTKQWATSTAVKCYEHGSKCSMPMATWKIPSSAVIKQWLLSVRPATPHDSKFVVAELRDQHMANLRKLRDAAVWSPSDPAAASSS